MILIPARLASTRFPKKVLHPIDGVPMVVRTAMQVRSVDEVVVATDSQEVVDIVTKHGFRAVLTNPDHPSGTDRVNEAAAKLGLAPDEVIVNVQADEPFIEPQVVQQVRDLTARHAREADVMLCSAYKRIGTDEAEDPNKVKVVCDAAGYALYFSRSLLPYPREACEEYKLHLGIYGYTRAKLEKFCSLAQAPLENIEKLEQLRALYHGFKIAMVEVKSQSIGIDTPEDLAAIS